MKTSATLLRNAIFDASYRLSKINPPTEMWVKMRGDDHPKRWLGFSRMEGRRSEIHVRVDTYDGGRMRQDRTGVNEIPDDLLAMVEATLPDLLDCLIANLEEYAKGIEAIGTSAEIAAFVADFDWKGKKPKGSKAKTAKNRGINGPR